MLFALTPERSDSCLNGRNEPINKETTRGGNKYSMYSIWKFLLKDGPPIPKRSLKKALRLILQETSFQFNERNYSVQTHGTAMGTKLTVAFANIIMVEILDKSGNNSARLETLHGRHNPPLARQQGCLRPD